MIHSPFADDFVRVSPAAENPKHNPGYDQEDKAQDGDEDDDHQGLGGEAWSNWSKDIIIIRSLCRDECTSVAQGRSLLTSVNTRALSLSLSTSKCAL